MTWPVTPDPGIHQDTQSVKQQQALFTQAQLLKWAEQLPLAMVKDLANAILGALGLTAIEGPLAALVAGSCGAAEHPRREHRRRADQRAAERVQPVWSDPVGATAGDSRFAHTQHKPGTVVERRL
jgi:hypothetical protein